MISFPELMQLDPAEVFAVATTRRRILSLAAGIASTNFILQDPQRVGLYCDANDQFRLEISTSTTTGYSFGVAANKVITTSLAWTIFSHPGLVAQDWIVRNVGLAPADAIITEVTLERAANPIRLRNIPEHVQQIGPDSWANSVAWLQRAASRNQVSKLLNKSRFRRP